MSTTSSPNSSRSSSRSASPQRRISRSICYPRHLNCLESFDKLSTVSSHSWFKHHDQQKQQPQLLFQQQHQPQQLNDARALSKDAARHQPSNQYYAGQNQLSDHSYDDYLHSDCHQHSSYYDSYYNRLNKLEQLNKMNIHNDSLNGRHQIKMAHRQAFFLPDDDDDDDADTTDCVSINRI